MIKECREVDYLKKEVKDEQLAQKLWDFSEKQIVALEKEGALRRKLGKETERTEKKEKEKEEPRVQEVDEPMEKASASGTPKKSPGKRRSRKA